MKSIEKVSKLRVPAMYLVGLNDQMINPLHTRKLFQATTNSKHCQIEVMSSDGLSLGFALVFCRSMKTLDIPMSKICLITSNDLIFHFFGKYGQYTIRTQLSLSHHFLSTIIKTTQFDEYHSSKILQFNQQILFKQQL